MPDQPKSTLTHTLGTRVTPTFKRLFVEKARRFGVPSDIHRELLEAFVDGRVTIVPDPNKPQKENLYES